MQAQEVYDQITELAAEMSAKLAAKYDGQPVEEFLAWLHVSLERETLVAEAYSNEYVMKKILTMKFSKGLNNFISSTLEWVWKQENAHKADAKAALAVIDPPFSAMEKIKRRLELITADLQANVCSKFVSGGVLEHQAAKVAIAIGQWVVEVPDFIRDWQTGNFIDYCLINMALEETAVLGYQRMLALLPLIKAQAKNPFQHWPIKQDLKKIYNDERYHHELFDMFSKYPPKNMYVPSPPPSPPGNNPGEPSPEGPGPFPDEGNFIRNESERLERIQESIYQSETRGILDVNLKLLFQDDMLLYMKEYFKNYNRDNDEGGEPGGSQPVNPIDPTGIGRVVRKKKAKRSPLNLTRQKSRQPMRKIKA